MNFGIFRRMLGILSNFYAFVSSHVIILEKIPLTKENLFSVHYAGLNAKNLVWQ